MANLGQNIERVNVELVRDKDKKFIRLTAAAAEEEKKKEGKAE